MASLKCAYCNKMEKSSVVDSRTDSNGFSVRRRRVCSGCGYRYTTYEVSKGNLKDMALQVLEIDIETEEKSIRRKSVTEGPEITGVDTFVSNTAIEDDPIGGHEEEASEVEDFAEEYGIL